MVQAIQKSTGTILKLVGRERDARLVALQEAQNERNLRVQAEQKLAEEEMIEALRAGAQAKFGCDPRHYPAHVSIAPETLASLAGDLR